KEEEKTFLEECARTGRTVLTAEEGRKIELMYQSVMALTECIAGEVDQ
ncbi:exodeoxyribonuclease 8, partial [Salmonella enterica]|nr:exodeoxyribonuclease 8 [Salmonella enterica subsp. enterica serovar Stanley]EDQ5486752.1 exodeoxyribonuclease 8 [Salmonella enterica]EEF7231535.1 exodeoxyribonuclease 8 [Salmonella enterica]